MAKQVGSYKITGTIDGICFYKMEGAYFARSKSSLDRKRYHSDPAFEGSRRSNCEMKTASPLASKLYKLMDPEKKGRPVYQKLVGRIKLLVKEGWVETKIVQWFKTEYLGEVTESKVIRREKNLKNQIKDFTKFYHDIDIRETHKLINGRRRMKNKEPSY